MIKYIGSKRVIIPHILKVASLLCPKGARVLDLFAGTSRVGHALKQSGYSVVANDHNQYAYLLALCYVQAERSRWERQVRSLLAEFSALPPRPGYFTDTFCVRSRFFQPKNGARVDAIREAIAAKCLPPELEAIVLVSLMEAADRVDSTAGLQMAYMKQWAARSNNDLELRIPAILDRTAREECRASKGEAEDVARSTPVDLAYLDPPYNQHSYLNNYHVWESLAVWDKPEVYGIACKRLDCRERKSVFNSKPSFESAFIRLLQAIRADNILVSFNDEGYIGRTRMEEILKDFGYLTTLEIPNARYVGAKIGIHNLKGEKVGTVKHLRNVEFIYVVSKTRVAVEAKIASGPQQAVLL